MEFCHNIQASGSANLANAKGCAFSFLDTEDVAEETQIVIKGALRDFSADDAKLLETALTAAYNDAYLNSKAAEFSVEAEAPLNSARCGGCRPDDDLGFDSARVIIASSKVG